jgi:hypothetical protein
VWQMASVFFFFILLSFGEGRHGRMVSMPGNGLTGDWKHIQAIPSSSSMRASSMVNVAWRSSLHPHPLPLPPPASSFLYDVLTHLFSVRIDGLPS